MADTTYYAIQYGGKEYRTADASLLIDAIKAGANHASILATGHGDKPIEVLFALNGAPIAVERRTRKDDSDERHATILL